MRNDAWVARFAPRRDSLAPIGLTLFLFVEILIFGANRADLSLFFAIVQLLGLAVSLYTRRGRQAFESLPLLVPGALFALVLAEALFSIIPFGPPIGHPLWAYVSSPGGSVSLDPTATRIEIVKLLGLAAVFFFGAAIGLRRDAAEVFVRGISFVGGVYAVWAFSNWVVDPFMIFGVARPFSGRRLAASFLSPNSAGTLFACLTMLQICAIVRLARRLPKPIWSRRTLADMQGLFWPLILSLLFSACLFATSSRGAVVAAGAAVAFTVLGFTFVGTSQRSATGGVTAAIAFVVLAALVLFMIGGNQVMERFGSENPLTNERVALFGGYWRSFLASPWWGYGLGAFDSFNFQSMTAPDAFTMGQMGAAHNVYLQWLLQTGLLGFVPMMTCIIWVLATIVRGLRRRASQQALLIFSLAATCVFAVHGTADFALEEPAMAALFAAILGLGYGVATRP